MYDMQGGLKLYNRFDLYKFKRYAFEVCPPFFIRVCWLYVNTATVEVDIQPQS